MATEVLYVRIREEVKDALEKRAKEHEVSVSQLTDLLLAHTLGIPSPLAEAIRRLEADAERKGGYATELREAGYPLPEAKKRKAPVKKKAPARG